MKLNVHQIYFSPEQQRQLSNITIPYYNQKLTPFFENDVIRDLYNKGSIHESDYFGVVSWRIEPKNRVSLNSLLSVNASHNMYTYRAITQRHHVIPMGSAYHANFGYLFERVLTNLGYNMHDLAPRVDLGLYQNAIIATREVYLDYVENWLLPSMKFMEENTDPTFVATLKSDPHYTLYPPGMRERLHAAFGVSHYCYHTFVLERLWSVYYEINKPKIRLYLL